MDGAVNRIVVVGGGTAGWLAACVLAARIDRNGPEPISVTLVESPDVATIGVGEGTWPTMRATLAGIGIAEADFLAECDAAFKQGSRFDGWRTGATGEHYYHPFTPPQGDAREAVERWIADGGRDFAFAANPQASVCAGALAPRQRTMPDYAGALNYGYHLDAAKLAQLLARHGTARLGVVHVRDHVVDVEAGEGEAIAAVLTRDHGRIAGDLFVDCSGHAALLIGGHHGVGTVERDGELFNDRALAVQVPVAPGSTIASQTNATAHAAGWIWDIGLPTRRGMGCVYSSAHMSDDAAAATLREHIAANVPGADLDRLTYRRLAFRSRHRERFWVGNCVAVGLAAGFLEPLEASAIVLVELSLRAIVDGFPAARDAMPGAARRFDALFRYRWDRIVDFLKLHYVLSERTEPYWRDHRDPASVSPRLAELLDWWRHHPPSAADLPMADEIFPAASYQYVLYGMGFSPPARTPLRTAMPIRSDEAERRARALAASLPTNRAYLDALAASRARPLMEQRS